MLERIPDRASTLSFERKNAARWIGASIFAALGLFVLSGVGVWKMQRRESREAPLIAVLPFESAGTTADSLLAERLGSAVTTKLSQLAGLRVIDRESVRSMQDSSRSARAMGTALGADYVLHASMHWVRDSTGAAQLHLRPVVLRVSNGDTRWAGGPEVMSLADPFTVETTLATKTANELDVLLGEGERTVLAAHGTRDTAAFAAFARADRLYRQNRTRSLPVYEQALREFERAYRIDARYADAFGGAALALARMGEAGAHPTRYDSVAWLARHALALAPEQTQALDAVATMAFAQGRPETARSWVDRAIGGNPSDVEGLELRVELLPLVGDSAGTWRDVERLVALAPRSADALVVAATAAQALRRFTEAGEFLQRSRQLEPDRIDLILRVATLGRASGNFRGMARAVREYRRLGGQLTAAHLNFLRVGDDAMQRELAESPPGALGVASRADSANYFSQKAQLFLSRRDAPRARALLDSSQVLLRLLLADWTTTASERRRYSDLMAWTDAARGERVRALAVATGMERDTLSLQFPNGQFAAGVACNSAEIYAFVDDVEEMIRQLRRCLTLPGGYAPSAISAEPALWRHAPDPRLAALLSEFKLEIRRKE